MIASRSLQDIAHVRHGFFTRLGGRSEGIYAALNCGFGSHDDPEKVAVNRDLVARRLGLGADRLMTAWQWHRADVHIAKGPWDPLRPPKADAMVTDVPGLALGVLTADCTPILFADHEAKVVGAAHAGWKGALDGVIEATVAVMEKLGAARERMVAAIGPTIAQPSYEVGPEFQARFVAHDAGHGRFFAAAERDGHFVFDLPGFVRSRLGSIGLADVEDIDLDTYADENRFFSYRRATHRGEPDYGRQISAIAIAT